MGRRSMKIRPFKALRPTEQNVERVASPPYDVMNRAEALQMTQGRPQSFLRIIRAETEMDSSVDAHDPAVYKKAAANLHEFIEQGIMVREKEPSLYVYSQTMGSHTQYGLVAVCSTLDYDNGLIKKHENTIEAKEQDRSKHVDILNANTGPVFLMYKGRPAVDQCIQREIEAAPLFHFTADDGIVHSVWSVRHRDECVSAFEGIEAFYIADGHHRAASAARVGRQRTKTSGDGEHNWFLSVVFPAEQLNILAYNRCVRLPEGLDTATLMNRIEKRFTVTECPSPGDVGPGEVDLYLDGRWRRISLGEEACVDPVKMLDVSRLQDGILQPLLGIEDPRTSDRIAFVGGIRGTKELERLVGSGLYDVAFAMHPVAPEDIMNVADAGLNMPPKSTWFEPKLRSGLFVHTLD